ncbi:hypothethical protein (plasmid) [Ralstonia solanacearum PSI07]|uniref:Hypothethical protein n=1 Tax=blood disease bacterium R229 TaxID=741978 RepID=G2ZS42_9RALS|nr:hypothethical protein [Ralstonia solanacearum PSI07]CCA81856.1 hypothethical protein [blood disease bacterium R229]
MMPGSLAAVGVSGNGSRRSVVDRALMIDRSVDDTLDNDRSVISGV